MWVMSAHARFAPDIFAPEFVSRAILKWVTDEGIATALIDPGKPWQNGVDESFNGKFRDECLNMEWFRSRTEARVVIASWLEHFNTVRPHSSLGYLTPRVFAAKCRNEPSPSEPATGGDMTTLRETLLAFVRVWFTYAGPLEREDDDDQAEALFDAFLDEVARGVRA